MPPATSSLPRSTSLLTATVESVARSSITHEMAKTTTVVGASNSVDTALPQIFRLINLQLTFLVRLLQLF